MLVLSRKLNEKIQLGDNITVTVLRVQGNTIRLGIDAPRDVRILRGELEPIDGQPNKKDHLFQAMSQEPAEGDYKQSPDNEHARSDETVHDDLSDDESAKSAVNRRSVAQARPSRPTRPARPLASFVSAAHVSAGHKPHAILHQTL